MDWFVLWDFELSLERDERIGALGAVSAKALAIQAVNQSARCCGVRARSSREI